MVEEPLQFDNIFELYWPDAPVQTDRDAWEGWLEQKYRFLSYLEYEHGYPLKSLFRGEDFSRWGCVIDEGFDRQEFIQVVQASPFVQGTEVLRMDYSRSLPNEPILRITFPLDPMVTAERTEL